MSQHVTKPEAPPTRAQEAGQRVCSHLYCVTYFPSHVGTSVAARTLLVLPETMLKAHSRDGHYANIRPVRLPNRKLAWPIAEIEKLFGAGTHLNAQQAGAKGEVTA